MSMADPLLTKTAFKKESYTADQLKGLAQCADLVTGPKHFLTNYFFIVHPILGREIIKPFDYQLDLLDAMSNNRFSINLLSRQLGKCVCGETTIRLKNKKTNAILDISIEEFFDIIKENAQSHIK